MNAITLCQEFAQVIKAKQQEIIRLLLKVQSVHTTRDEIKRSIDALETIGEVGHLFDRPVVERVVSFLPLNLPLYSLVIFACIPSLQAERLTLRVPRSLQGLFAELGNLLEFQSRFPKIFFFNGDKHVLLNDYCRQSQVIIFTGRPNNFRAIQQHCRKDTLILYNGVGHNPLVITEFADVDLAVSKSLEVKLFNNGQDCAGPDAILLHRAIAPLFLEKLSDALLRIPIISSYEESVEGLLVGPLYDLEDLKRAAGLVVEMQKQGMRIVYGGSADFRLRRLDPIVIVGELEKHCSYDELYAPIFSVLTYSDDSELAAYFQDDRRLYSAKEMYVSVFDSIPLLP